MYNDLAVSAQLATALLAALDDDALAALDERLYALVSARRVPFRKRERHLGFEVANPVVCAGVSLGGSLS